ncbi:MAG: autotransporter-associated beta strand repeat-containing protein, partial [Verrucomicrobiota bacterium]
MKTKSNPFLRLSALALIGFTFVMAGAQATPLYWDSNGATAGAGTTPTGTWGTSNFWNTDPTGGAGGAFQIPSTSADNLYFSAGPGAGSGDATFTVTVTGTQAANSLTFQASATTGKPTLSGGIINLGAGGLTLTGTAGNTTINSSINLTADQTWNLGGSPVGSYRMHFGGNLGGSGNLTITSTIATQALFQFDSTVTSDWTGSSLTIESANVSFGSAQQLATWMVGKTLLLKNNLGGTTIGAPANFGGRVNFSNNIVFSGSNVSGFGVSFIQDNNSGATAVNPGYVEVLSGVISGVSQSGAVTFMGGTAGDFSGTGQWGSFRISGNNTGWTSTTSPAIYARSGYTYLDNANALGTNNSLSVRLGNANVGTTVGAAAAGLFTTNGINVTAPITILSNSGAGVTNGDAYLGLDGAGAATYSAGAVTLGTSATAGKTINLHLRALAGGIVTFSNQFIDSLATDAYTPSVLIDGGGTVVLTGTGSQYKGSTSVNAGTLKLDFSARAGATNILNSTSNASALVLGGGTLNVVGKAAATNSQRFNGTSLNPGASGISLTANAASNPLLLTLGALTRNAASTVDFTLPAGTQSATNGITTTSTTFVSNNVLVSAASNGIAFATSGGSDWASLSGGNVATLASYNANSFAATDNTDVTGTQTPGSGITVNTLRFNDTAVSSVTLSGVNTVNTGGVLVTAATATNGATIAGGSLQAGTGKELVLINNGKLAVSSTFIDNATASDLSITGSGTTTLSGANTYTGVTTVTGGTLNVANLGSALGNATSPLVLGCGSSKGTLAYTGNSATYTRGFKLGTGGGEIDVTTAGQTLTLGASTNAGGLINSQSTTSTYGDLILVGAGNLNFANAGLGQGFGGLVKNGSGTATLNSATYVLNGSALTASTTYTLATAGGVQIGQAVTGTGVAANTKVTAVSGTTITLSAATTAAVTDATFATANTYNGTTTINSGTLALGFAAALPSYSPIVINGGTLNLGTVTTTAIYASATLNGGSIIGSGTLTLTTSPLYATSGTISAKISGAGNPVQGSLIKTGSGTLTLSAANTYSGLTTVSGGTLAYGITNALASGPVTVSGGIWDLATFSDTVGAVTLSSGSITSTTGVLNLSGSALNATSGTISAIIGGTGSSVGSLAKTGSGTLTLSGVNTYTGATVINGGTLAVSGSGKLGGPTAPLTLNAGTLDLGATAQTVAAVTLNGGSITNGTLTGTSYSLTDAGSVSAILA